MYFYYKDTKSGKTLQLLESYRNEDGNSRHRVVVSLGDPAINKKDWPIIANAVESKLFGYQPLEIGHTSEINKWIDIIIKRIEREGKWEPIEKNKIKKSISDSQNQNTEEIINGVILDKTEHTHTTSLGPELLGLKAWKTLEMDEKLEDLGFNPLQIKTAATSVISRLTNPGSEHELLESLNQSSFPDIFGEDLLQGAKDRFYRVSDKLLDNKEAIETHLRNIEQKHFGFDRTILLYDLTNTHFEGVCENNPKAKRGHNKQKRDDCPQIVVGMIFDEHGFELAHNTFEGNKSDQKSLLDMVKRMNEISKKDDLLLNKKPIVIVDGGISSKENLKLLRDNGYDYLVNDSRRCRKQYEKEFQESDFKTVSGRENKNPVKIKVILEDREESQDEDTKTNTENIKHREIIHEQVILCRSEERKEKEKAILSVAEERLLKQLKSLEQQIEKGQLKDRNKVERKIGRIISKNSRSAHFYKIEIKEKDSKLELIYERIKDKYDKNQDVLGCYILRTSELNIKGDELWKLYLTLTKAEEGFRYLKSDLGLRPNHHQKECRVDGHVFITVLAYHLLKFITHTLESTGDTRSFFTVRRVLETHCYATLILETTDGAIYRLRKPGLPEECQKEIYDIFDIDCKKLPKTKSVTYSKNQTTL